MGDISTYCELRKLCLKYVEKITRYRHHIVFNSTYIKFNLIPKGFKIRHHNNIEGNDIQPVLRKCSKKLIIKAIGAYKRKLKISEKSYNDTRLMIENQYIDKMVDITQEIDRRFHKLRSLLLERRRKKFKRDGLHLQTAEEHASKLLQSLIVGPSVADDLKCEILSNVDIPPYSPINLDSQNRDLPIGLTELCSRGPSFIPTPVSFDWLQMQKDFDKFSKNMRTQVFFANKEKPAALGQKSKFDVPPKTNSNWDPPKSTIPELETFLSLIEREIFSNTKRRKVEDNLSELERKALNTWRKNNLFNENPELLIRQQDKGNRFVLIDKITDVNKAEEQIQKSSFRELHHDPTLEHLKKVMEWVEKWHAKGQITEQWKNFIIKNEAQPGKNVPLYKTHKDNIPARLLTSGCNTAIENASIFLEKQCAPLTADLPSRIRDTGHLLDIIDTLNDQGLPPGTFLASLDVISMFPNIDNERGLHTLRSILNKRKIKKPSTSCITDGLRLCLYNNNSVFNNKHFIQTNGTATGAPNSCSYSDLAVKPIDDAIFSAQKTLFKDLHFYGRYRDDCLILWLGPQSRLNQFHDFVNTIDENLKFTMEIGGDSINFLDVKISIVDNVIHTTVYSKPTDSHLYLQAESCHQLSTICGIQKGVALRLRKICSTICEYDEKSKQYMAYLVARGHDPITVKRTFEEARERPRNDIRNPPSTNTKKTGIVFSTKYNPRGPNLKEIIRKHLKIIDTPQLKKIFPCGVSLIYKRENNIKELLTKSDPYSIKKRSHIYNYKQL